MAFFPLGTTAHVLQIDFTTSSEMRLVGEASRIIDLRMKIVLPESRELCNRVALADIAEYVDQCIKQRLADEGPQPETTPSGRPRRRLLDE